MKQRSDADELKALSSPSLTVSKRTASDPSSKGG